MKYGDRKTASVRLATTNTIPNLSDGGTWHNVDTVGGIKQVAGLLERAIGGRRSNATASAAKQSSAICHRRSVLVVSDLPSVWVAGASCWGSASIAATASIS